MDDLLSVLHRSSQLRVDALANEHDLNQGEVSQMGPAHSREDVELLSPEVWYISKREPVAVGLDFQLLLQVRGRVWVFFRMVVLQVAVKDEHPCRNRNQEQCESEILDKQVDKLARADTFLFDQEVVLAIAFLAVYALTDDYLCRLAIHVNFLARALTRLAEPCRHLDILKVGHLCL